MEWGWFKNDVIKFYGYEHLILCSRPNEYNWIFTCESVKEIWDRFEVTHEGNSQVKEFKINILVHNYELFKMKSDESIIDIFTRFTDIHRHY